MPERCKICLMCAAGWKEAAFFLGQDCTISGTSEIDAQGRMVS